LYERWTNARSPYLALAMAGEVARATVDRGTFIATAISRFDRPTRSVVADEGT